MLQIVNFVDEVISNFLKVVSKEDEDRDSFMCCWNKETFDTKGTIFYLEKRFIIFSSQDYVNIDESKK